MRLTRPDRARRPGTAPWVAHGQAQRRFVSCVLRGARGTAIRCKGGALPTDPALTGGSSHGGGGRKWLGGRLGVGDGSPPGCPARVRGADGDPASIVCVAWWRCADRTAVDGRRDLAAPAVAARTSDCADDTGRPAAHEAVCREADPRRARPAQRMTRWPVATSQNPGSTSTGSWMNSAPLGPGNESHTCSAPS